MKIAVYAEADKGSVTTETKELFALGGQLAGAYNGELQGIVLGSCCLAAGEQLIQLGAKTIYTVEHPLLDSFETRLYARALIALFQKHTTPDLLLFSHNQTGRDLVPFLAVQLKAGACLDCTDLTFNEKTGLFHGVHPFYGGNVVGLYTTNNKPQLFTMRKGGRDCTYQSVANNTEIIPVSIELNSTQILARVIKRTFAPPGEDKLEDASVIVSGGRGIGGTEGFALLRELAAALGGTVGASRSAVDAGWIEAERQIGLTGKFVNPDLYIAVGISGATQHMAGCSTAKTIIAVNRDPESPIFRRAHYGIIADYKNIIPLMIKKSQRQKC